MLMYLWVAIGGALGSMGRFWLSGLVANRFGETFPFGTLVINLTGSSSESWQQGKNQRVSADARKNDDRHARKVKVIYYRVA
jgi:hypothetical protein